MARVKGRDSTESRTPFFITEKHLQDMREGATVDDASQVIKWLHANGWSVTYGEGPAWQFADEDEQEEFAAAFKEAVESLDGEEPLTETEHDAHEIEALDPREPIESRRAHVQRVGVKIVELVGRDFDKLHGPAVAFVNQYHEKRVRKVSREWFAAVSKGDPEAAMFVATCDGQIIGAAAARDKGAAAGFTIVHPDYRRLRIGTQLAKAKIARTGTYTTRVAIDNESCLHLMFKCGLQADSIAVSESNGKTVIRFLTPPAVTAAPPEMPARTTTLTEAVAKVKKTERHDGRPPEWVIWSWCPISEVKRSDQLLVGRVNLDINRDEPKGSFRVPLGRNSKLLDASHRIPGEHLYREDARDAKKAWLAENKKKVRSVSAAEIWGYEG